MIVHGLRMFQAAVDIVLSGFGWLAITPTPVVGTKLWHNTIAHGSIKMTTHPGVPLFLRHPMLPYEADGTSPGDWKT